MTVVSAADWPLPGPRLIGLYGAFATENSYEAAVHHYPAADAPPVPRTLNRSPGRAGPAVPPSVRREARRFADVCVAVLMGRSGNDVLRRVMSDAAYVEFCQVRRLLDGERERPVDGRLSSIRPVASSQGEVVEIVLLLSGARRDRAVAVTQERRGGELWCTRFQLV